MKLPRLRFPNPFRGMDWFEAYLSVFLFLGVLFFAYFLYFSIMAEVGSSRVVPKESCVETRTGSSRQQVYYVQQCQIVASNGTCAVSISIPQTYDQAEFSTVCSFKEWK